MQHNIFTLWGVNMTTSSRTCPVPAVNGHMTHYPPAPYPLLFPPVLGGLSLPSLHGLQSHPPTSGCSTPSPASKCLVLIAFIDQFSSNKDWLCSFWNYFKSNCSCSSVMYFSCGKSMHLFWNRIFTKYCINTLLYDTRKPWKRGVIKPAVDFGTSCIMLTAESSIVFKEKAVVVYSRTAMISQYRILLSCAVISAALVFSYKYLLFSWEAYEEQPSGQWVAVSCLWLQN